MELAEGGSLGDLIGNIPHTLRMPTSYATHAYLIRYELAEGGSLGDLIGNRALIAP